MNTSELIVQSNCTELFKTTSISLPFLGEIAEVLHLRNPHVIDAHPQVNTKDHEGQAYKKLNVTVVTSISS